MIPLVRRDALDVELVVFDALGRQVLDDNGREANLVGQGQGVLDLRQLA